MNSGSGIKPHSFLLLHINSYYATNSLHSELVFKLDSENKQIVYIPLGRKDKMPENQYQVYKNTTVIFRRCFNSFSRMIWPLKMIKIWKTFRSDFKNIETPDLIHAHSLIVNGLIAYISYKRNGIPYIVTIRNTDINIFMKNSILLRKLGEKIISKASSVVFLTPAYMDTHLKKLITGSAFKSLERKYCFIPNGVNDFWIRNLATAPKKLNGSSVNILFVGKLQKNKNIINLLEACKLICNKDIKIILNVVGDGPLKELFKTNKFEFPVNYYGFISGKEQLLNIYRDSHILAVPSFTESFGLVYVEAMSQALPVIYSRGQGIDGYFPDGFVGYAVDPYKKRDIADKIMLIKARYNTLSANALTSAVNFSWENTVNKLTGEYKKVLNETVRIEQ
ncbi:MAG TPA: glycosyltransferase family 4 protein [Bacteroidales bacterium]|nr:glycosyltransferase family 4 protein [Bacteroidales bacterium]HQK68433.1 glycosyltransferase family 4 protein [Bacteroidales bacterium]